MCVCKGWTVRCFWSFSRFCVLCGVCVCVCVWFDCRRGARGPRWWCTSLHVCCLSLYQTSTCKTSTMTISWSFSHFPVLCVICVHVCMCLYVRTGCAWWWGVCARVC